jgi:hypothetical protein
MRLFWLRRPHVPLLVLLIALLALYPLIDMSEAAQWVFQCVVLAGIVFSLHRVHAESGGIRMAALLGLIALVAQLIDWMAPAPAPAPLPVGAALAQIGFYVAAASLQVRYILRDARATIDELFSAAVAFLLLSLAWAWVYWTIEYVRPGSFALAREAAMGPPSWYALFYFSVTTLSTTGYGDIVPVSSAARSAAILEQIAGVLYVALIISRLAGFAGRGRAAKSPRPDSES